MKRWRMTPAIPICVLALRRLNARKGPPRQYGPDARRTVSGSIESGGHGRPRSPRRSHAAEIRAPPLGATHAMGMLGRAV